MCGSQRADVPLMREIAISELKAKCHAVVNRVRRTRIPVRITRFGKPIADIIPVASARPKIRMGFMKDKMTIVGDIISPVIGTEE
jgi:prevent-host-death family protein